jgi:SAM-dependent methyltransferase
MIFAYGFRRLRKISPSDTMFRWDEPRHYAAVGQSARACITACLAAGERRHIHRILDYGCGYGRVLRVLKKEFPEATVTACDVDRGGVDYCVGAFGVEGIYGSTDARELDLDREFDLIWVGSVFTHLDESAWSELLPVLRGALADTGMLIFTTQGPDIASKLRKGELDYGLDRPALESVLREYTDTGFGYGVYPNVDRHDYPSAGRYGISVVDPDVVQSLAQRAGLRVVTRIPMGWDHHQDVFACGRG